MRRLWVITGATRGLGNALLHMMPYDDMIIRIGRMPVQLRSETHQLGHVIDVCCDLSVPSIAEMLVSQAYDHVMSTNIEIEFAGLINCAAENLIIPTDDLSAADFERLLNVNVVSPALLARALIKKKWTPMPYNPVIVVNIGSNAAKGAGAHSLAYVASKHALTGVTRSLARDYNQRAITFQVNFGKLEGTEMSSLIDHRQAELRQIPVEQERIRQKAGWVGGREIPLESAAGFVMNLISDPNIDQLNGGIFDYGC